MSDAIITVENLSKNTWWAIKLSMRFSRLSGIYAINVTIATLPPHPDTYMLDTVHV
jgi:hypothetical protein